MTFIEEIQQNIQRACQSDTVLKHYKHPDPKYFAEDRKNCRLAVQLLKTVILQDDKDIYVHAPTYKHFQNFQDSVREKCRFVEDGHILQGLRVNNLIVIGCSPRRPILGQEYEKRTRIYELAGAYRTRIWEIEEWC